MLYLFMRNYKSIAIITAVVFLVSCGPSLESLYESNYTLTSRRVFSRTGQLSFKIPVGWYAVEDNEKNIFDIWIVREDYKSYFTLVPLNIEEDLQIRQNTRERIETLLHYSKYFKEIEKGFDFEEQKKEVFELKNRLFAAYEYKTADNFTERVVVFDYKNISFEFSAVCSNPAICDSLYLTELYKIQNSVLTSLKE